MYYASSLQATITDNEYRNHGFRSKFASNSERSSDNEDTLKSGCRFSFAKSVAVYFPVSSSKHVNAPARFPQAI